MKFGFTLAEVLITLGIVGVVASMTLPTLNNNVQKQTYEAGAKKAYNIISNAVGMYMVDQGVDDLSETPLYNNTDGLKAFVNKYFRVSIDCGNRYYNSNGASCFSKDFYSMDRSQKVSWVSYQCMQVVTIADGMAMCFDSGKIQDATAGEDTNGDGVVDEKDTVSSSDYGFRDGTPLTIEVDINGPNGPNVTGRDIFLYVVSRNGLVGSKLEGCDTQTQDGRDKCVALFTKHASPMPIGLLQYYGWKMKY